MKIFKKYKKWLFRFFVIVSSLALFLCPFSVSALSVSNGNYTLATFEIVPQSMVFRTINSSGVQSNVYATETLSVNYNNILNFSPSTQWRDNLIMGDNGLGSWDINYGHSLLMTRFDVTQCNLIEGVKYQIVIPFFILSDIGTDITLNHYGGGLNYGDGLEKIQLKSVQLTKHTFTAQDDSGTYSYKGYYGKYIGTFTYNSSETFNSLRTVLYFNSTSGVFRWFGIYNSISVTEVNPATVAKYQAPDDDLFNDYNSAESDLVGSTTQYRDSALSFFRDTGLSIFGNVTFLSSIKAVNNMLLYLWSSSWLGRLVSFSLLIGAFGFIIGTVSLVGRFGGKK